MNWNSTNFYGARPGMNQGLMNTAMQNLSNVSVEENSNVKNYFRNFDQSKYHSSYEQLLHGKTKHGMNTFPHPPMMSHPSNGLSPPGFIQPRASHLSGIVPSSPMTDIGNTNYLPYAQNSSFRSLNTVQDNNTIGPWGTPMALPENMYGTSSRPLSSLKMNFYRDNLQSIPEYDDGLKLANSILSNSAKKISGSNRAERFSSQVIETYAQMMDLMIEFILLGSFEKKCNHTSKQTSTLPQRIDLTPDDILSYIKKHFKPEI